MSMAKRIQDLRKMRGISQEQLAEKVGVSRQAVSKWESEQSIPDLDKIITMSEFFGVTTDYLLKGVESTQLTESSRSKSSIFRTYNANFVAVATALNFIGLVVACAVWYERQVSTAIAIGLVLMALGCMVYLLGTNIGMGLMGTRQEEKDEVKCRFWRLNIWLLSFLILSVVYNMLVLGRPAPYPLLAHPLISFPLFWVVYMAVCLGVVFACSRRSRRTRTV